MDPVLAQGPILDPVQNPVLDPVLDPVLERVSQLLVMCFYFQIKNADLKQNSSVAASLFFA